jgi:hypothetical protein
LPPYDTQRVHPQFNDRHTRYAYEASHREGGVCIPRAGVIPPLMFHDGEQNGWRHTYRVLALISLCFAPIGWAFYRDTPETFGLLPDGEIAVHLLVWRISQGGVSTHSVYLTGRGGYMQPPLPVRRAAYADMAYLILQRGVCAYSHPSL